MSTTTLNAASDELTEARRTAIETSGWGAPFRFIQPRNACFWIYVALVVVGAKKFYDMAAPTAGVFAAANTAAAVCAALFCLLFLAYLPHADKFEGTPAGLALVAFAGGGFIATWVVALPGNGALMDIYTKIFGQVWATDWKAGLTAPFVEESAKGAIFLLLLGLAPVVIRTVYDGLIVGAYIGLGFQVLEDVLYGQNSAYAHFGDDQVGSVLHTFAMRAVTGIASHALYTALFAAGLIYLIGTVAQPRRVGRGLALMLAAVVVHGVWDSVAAIVSGNEIAAILLMLTITVVSVILLTLAIRWGARRERGFLHAVLAPEVANGTITELELAAVAGEHGDRRQDRRAALRGRQAGTSRRREKHVLAAARGLAQDLASAQVAGEGEESAAVQHARSEIRRLRGAPAIV
ncbi:PrsW family intramembrane metalloprotease [Nocardia sp. NPDC050717]|uniref:PrsW family intramembrane metalloprotease n=1 Tax=Nocardia sp. NPDC050717 TaxID=3157221 RepID=UPI0033C74EE4